MVRNGKNQNQPHTYLLLALWFTYFLQSTEWYIRNHSWHTSIGTQQSNICSWYHRQGLFQIFFGSTSRAFRTITRVVRPQKAGSSCVQNWDASTKYVSMWPSRSASWNILFPEKKLNKVHSILTEHISKSIYWDCKCVTASWSTSASS